MPITYANAKSNKNNLCQIKIKKKKKKEHSISLFFFKLCFSICQILDILDHRHLREIKLILVKYLSYIQNDNRFKMGMLTPIKYPNSKLDNIIIYLIG